MIKVIIFDLGGIIIPGVAHPISVLLSKKHKIASKKIEKVIRLYWGNFAFKRITEKSYWKKVINVLKLNETPENIERLARIIMNKTNENVIKTILLLKRNYRIVLLTDVPKEWFIYLNNRLDLKKVFSDIFVSYKIKLGKPHLVGTISKNVQIYHYVLQKLNVSSNECLLIDDHVENLVYPKKLGMKTILFKSSKQLTKDLKKLGVL